MENKGSILLKIASIIMMVGGILSAVGSIVVAALAGVATGINAAYGDGSADKNITVLWIGVAILVIAAVVQIIAGVKGKKNWNNPQMAMTLIIWGAVCLALSILGNILFSSGGADSIVLSIITGVALPVVYIIGAFQLKKMS